MHLTGLSVLDRAFAISPATLEPTSDGSVAAGCRRALLVVRMLNRAGQVSPPTELRLTARSRHRLMAAGIEVVDRSAALRERAPANTCAGDWLCLPALEPTAIHALVLTLDARAASPGVHTLELELRPPAARCHDSTLLTTQFVVAPNALSDHDEGAPDSSSAARWALVIDEDPLIRSQLSRSFGAAGMQVCAVSTSREALAAAEARGGPFIATSELRVGEDSGLRLLRDLSQTFGPVRTAIVSLRPSIASAVQATRLGIDAYLGKPTTATAIFAALSPDWGEFEAPPAAHAVGSDDEWLSLERAKWEYISLVLGRSQSLAQAARRLGLQPRSLRRMLQKHPPCR